MSVEAEAGNCSAEHSCEPGHFLVEWWPRSFDLQIPVLRHRNCGPSLQDARATS